MGEPIRWSVSVDKETDAIAEILQLRYSAIVGDKRSRLIQFIFKSWHRLNMTAANVTAALEQSQGINQEILSEEITTFNNSSQNEFPASSIAPRNLAGPKPPVRAINPTTPGRSRGRHVSGVSRRVATGAYGITFFPLHLHLDSTRRAA